MKRLTFKDGRGRNTILINGQERHGEIADRLAAYENTDLAPEEIGRVLETLQTVQKNKKEMFEALRKYLDAEAAGRLLILPTGIQIGKRVFHPVNGKLMRTTPTEEPRGDRITQIKVNRGGIHIKCWWGYFHYSDIGKTVFLTREAAEAELEKQKGGRGCGEG